jgi:hypothetical protein
MSKQIGVKRLQALVDVTWAMYPGGEIPQAGQAKYDWGRITAVRLYDGDFLKIDAVVRPQGLEIEVHRRTTTLTWGREVLGQDKLWETAQAFQRAAFLLGLAEAER